MKKPNHQKFNFIGKRREEMADPHLYVGFVEYNRDPQRRGRVKVRVPVLHGPESYDEAVCEAKYRGICTHELPWFHPIQPYGTGKELGAFNVPPVGAMVIVAFLGGDREYGGVYFGGITSTPSGRSKWHVTKTTVSPPDYYGENVYPPLPAPYWSPEGWEEEQGPEAPVESRERIVFNIPDVNTIAKTLLGSIIGISDHPNDEELFLIQRLGAGLRFFYPTPETTERPERRYRETGIRPFWMDQDLLTSGVGRADLFDPWGQGIRIVTDTKKYADYISLQTYKHEDPSIAPEAADEGSEIRSGNTGITFMVFDAETETRVTADQTRLQVETLAAKAQADLLNLEVKEVEWSGTRSTLIGEVSHVGQRVQAGNVISEDIGNNVAADNGWRFEVPHVNEKPDPFPSAVGIATMFMR